MSGTTINPYRFGGQVGYRRDAPARQYVRARHLDTAKGRWDSRDPIGFDGGDKNLYRYVLDRPTVMADASGTTPCTDRTAAYCRAARCSNNPAEWCFCHVSGLVCDFFIDNPRLPRGERERLDCLNHCMFNHWKRKDTDDWRKTGPHCSNLGKTSPGCCASYITAEQNGLTQCDLACKSLGPINRNLTGRLSPFPFDGPEHDRVLAGFRLCCTGGFPGAPAGNRFGGYPGSGPTGPGWPSPER